ncbi:tetratricopeptide repeat protein 30A-like [Pollicipes pollicipes]|uniref:tetratricopeptide repeat protein 30A-like n=1 Tax=Pollicipes pollicipes TaxID=41117 RepID=UPI0018858C7D|nr:tetratricopeptide repeat protein 30A-like [Pollicipes pollicipes]
MKETSQIDNPDYASKVTKLQAAIKYGQEDLAGAKSMVEQCPSDDPDTAINQACLLFKDERYDEAATKFTHAQQVVGYMPHLSYNIALCHYKLKHYAPALKAIADIIQQGIQQYPGA